MAGCLVASLIVVPANPAHATTQVPGQFVAKLYTEAPQQPHRRHFARVNSGIAVSAMLNATVEGNNAQFAPMQFGYCPVVGYGYDFPPWAVGLTPPPPPGSQQVSFGDPQGAPQGCIARGHIPGV